MSDVVLDASAVLALLRGEAGAAKVAGAIEGARMCTVNHAEIVSHYAKLGGARDAIADMLRPLPIALVAADAKLATIAGMMRAPTMEAGLSLGDRFCLALARRDNLPAWMSDKAWKTIAAAAGVKVTLIR